MTNGLFISLVVVFCVSLFFTLLAIFMSLTNGLFFARSFDQFKHDMFDPAHEVERRAGLTFKRIIFSYITPLGIASLILLVMLGLLKNC